MEEYFLKIKKSFENFFFALLLFLLYDLNNSW